METRLKKKSDGYGYKYTELAEIHNYLEQNDMRYIQQIKRIENDDYVMTKRCFGDKWEDEWLQGCKVVDATLQGIKNPAQEQGSALTYARRYSLLMAFGLATEDDDAQSLSKEKKEEPKKELKATESQIKLITTRLNEEQIKKVIDGYKLKELTDLTVSQASAVIKKLPKENKNE